MARHDWRMLIEAGLAISRYDACPWIGGVDVPTSVVVTTRDRTVGAGRQMQLAASIPDATVHPVEGGHISCARPEFATPLLRACTDVAERV